MKPRTVIIALEVTTAAPAKLLKDRATWVRALEQSGCGASSVQQVQMNVPRGVRSPRVRTPARKTTKRRS